MTTRTIRVLGKRKASETSTSDVDDDGALFIAGSDQKSRKRTRRQLDSEESESGSESSYDNDSDEDYQYDSRTKKQASLPSTPHTKAVRPLPDAFSSVLSTPSPLNKRPCSHVCSWTGCTKSYARPGRLKEHIRTHTGERPFKCTLDGCTSTFMMRKHLVSHMWTHESDLQKRPLACPKDGCTAPFWQRQNLKDHLESIHKEGEGFSCSPCSKSFDTACMLRLHKSEEHGHGITRVSKQYRCRWQGCAKSFVSPSAVEIHMRTHTGEKPFQCSADGCQARFRQAGQLRTHMRRYRCGAVARQKLLAEQEVEEDRFLQHQSLHSNQDNVHEHAAGLPRIKSLHIAQAPQPKSIQRYRCNYNACRKSYGTVSSLNLHIKRNHGGSRFICMDASHAKEAGPRPAFADLPALEAHHTSEHPLRCPFPACKGATFLRKPGLGTHCRYLHRNEAPEQLQHCSSGLEGQSDVSCEEQSEGREGSRERSSTVEGYSDIPVPQTVPQSDSDQLLQTLLAEGLIDPALL